MATFPNPKEIKFHQQSKLLEIIFDDNTDCMLSSEFLRVYSPSAEVQGHSPEQAVLQIGKENVSIINIEPVGNYAIKIIFTDGHDTGLYSWQYLHKLAKNYQELWTEYIGKLEASGIRRVKNEE